MPTIEKVSIALSSDLLAVVRRAVATGDYASTSEVVREALREWKRQRPDAVEPVDPAGTRGPLLPLTAARLAQIRRLCRQFGVRRLAVFGSALGPDFSSAKDVDLVVVFAAGAPHSLVDQYLGFKSGLEALFGKPVDLVELAAMPDSRLKRHIEQTARDIHVEPAAT